MFRRLATALFCLVPAVVAAQSRPINHDAIRATRIVTAVRTTQKITLDGHLDEPMWKQAPAATDFYQKLPSNGAPATDSTEAHFLYDDDNLYIGVICEDSAPEAMMIRDLREDFDFSTTDLVQIFIDSLHDRRSGFTFVVNPAGARRDSQVSTNGGANQDWDGVWDAKVSRDEHAWYIEFQIPFKTVRFSRAPKQEWGLNLTRRIIHLNEESNWAPVQLRFSGNQADMAGTLRGLENIRQGRNLKIKPYVIGGGLESRVAGLLRTTRDTDAGFDVKYSLTPSLTLDTTFRTDFAQVEVDQQQVNLTRFNLFFPEKRDFFLENSGTFAVGAGNRNGNNPSANVLPFFSRRIGLSQGGTPIPILGGARVTGTAGRNDVGALMMRTESLDATSTSRAVPANNYMVGRYKRNLLRTSWLGATVTDRESSTPGDYNRVYGPDVHFQFYRKLEIDSYLLRSDTPRRDGNNLAKDLLAAWKDDEWTVSGEYATVQPNFNPEVGFVRRSNNVQYSADVAWNPLIRRSAAIRNLKFAESYDYYQNALSRQFETRSYETTAGVQLENNGSLTLVSNQSYDRLVAPFAIRANTVIPVGDYQSTRYTASLNSGNNRKLGMTASAAWGGFWSGTNTTYTAGLTARPNYHLNVDLSYSRNDVTLPVRNGRFTTGLVGAKIVYGFTPRAFFNAFLQYNADTHQVSSNLRFDFIHHPLSDLYVVYNDRRDTTGRLLLERGLIVKLTHLLNF